MRVWDASCRLTGMRNKPRCCTIAEGALGLALLVALVGCATNDPQRNASFAWNGQSILPRDDVCGRVYADTDALIWQEMRNPGSSVHSRNELNAKIAKMIHPALSDVNDPASRCWRTSYENHQGLPAPAKKSADFNGPVPGYDLLIAEFDDQGEQTDVSRGRAIFEKSEVSLIEAQLEAIVREEIPRGGGINLVLFTHGWHGSAAATDAYSIWFKSILDQITYFEGSSRRSVCHLNHPNAGAGLSIEQRTKLAARREEYACSSAEPSDNRPFAERRTVGIEISWRGDSEIIPLLTWANFWDRKGAAQTVAKGAIHDLMARLHNFYVAHSCHARTISLSPNGEPCDAVHLLTIGHSFGALIDYHALVGDLSTGLLGDHDGRAYGFGDLTVLLNPAFEGERELALVNAATHRAPYPSGLDGQGAERARAAASGLSRAQLPTLVTLQSRGDWATHYAFPAARFFTSVFENTPGAGEYERSLEAAGWVEDYRTLSLAPGKDGDKDNCDVTGRHPVWYCPFDSLHDATGANPVVLQWVGAAGLPDYLPLWSVAVDKSIMRDHDDISDPAIVRFVARLFRTAYEQEDFLHEGSAQPVGRATDAH